MLAAWSIVFAFTCPWATASSAAGAPAPPSLILISIDTLRADALGCYGNEPSPSPFLDRLAGRGIRFADATAPAPWTLPSHASLFTGLEVASHGVRRDADRLPASAITLAEHLSAAGYRCAAFTGGGYLHRSFGLGRGFEHYQDKGGATGDILARAERWISVVEPEEPVFLFLHTYGVHATMGGGLPYTADPADLRRFVPEGTELERLSGGLELLHRVILGQQSLEAADLEVLRALYHAALAGVDRAFGQFFERLEHAGLRDAVVCVVSDHGEGFEEHGLLSHASALYEEFLQVPWLLSLPSGPRGAVVETPVSLIDVAPTLAAVLGRPLRGQVDGRVRWPAGEPTRREAIFAEMRSDGVAWPELMRGRGMDYEFDCTAIREGDWKLHQWRSGEVELFDLSGDASEKADVAATRPEEVSRLRRKIEEHLDGE